MTALLCLAAVALGAARVRGARSRAYQAAAHLFVGGLVGAALVSAPPALCRYAGPAAALSALEVLCFVLLPRPQENV
ncbi:hypothetical protein [Frigoriglobus tundricola]|uniref:Uncharacterized protein n=1 Tax=Frigoriglobus tundricola TaxID=2774151 RepID=A0A6M5Z0I8_9BACT|nr:hypothetical protein [Frigoriglobus tundricola]QJW98722.1 hypothetical protein FTUN_6317 [Frigoriglobus tundricola]